MTFLLFFFNPSQKAVTAVLLAVMVWEAVGEAIAFCCPSLTNVPRSPGQDDVSSSVACRTNISSRGESIKIERPTEADQIPCGRTNPKIVVILEFSQSH